MLLGLYPGGMLLIFLAAMFCMTMLTIMSSWTLRWMKVIR